MSPARASSGATPGFALDLEFANGPKGVGVNEFVCPSDASLYDEAAPVGALETLAPVRVVSGVDVAAGFVSGLEVGDGASFSAFVETGFTVAFGEDGLWPACDAAGCPGRVGIVVFPVSPPLETALGGGVAGPFVPGAPGSSPSGPLGRG